MITPEQTQLLAALRSADRDHYMAKFCQGPKGWLAAATRTFRESISGALDDRSHILDIGCGFGYFVSACQEAGHDARGIDVPDTMIQQASHILGIPYDPCTVTANKRLPREYRDLDAVTSFGVMFRHGPPGESGNYWGWPEYAFLAWDICDRLRPGGRWIIRPNKVSEQGHDFSYLLDDSQWNAAVGDFATVTSFHGQITLMPRKGSHD